MSSATVCIMVMVVGYSMYPTFHKIRRFFRMDAYWGRRPADWQNWSYEVESGEGGSWSLQLWMRRRHFILERLPRRAVSAF